MAQYSNVPETPNKVNLPLSADTSRSPIPIDPETFKQMNMILPKNLDGSERDLTSIAHASKLNSRVNSSAAFGSNETTINADLSTVHKVMPNVLELNNANLQSGTQKDV